MCAGPAPEQQKTAGPPAAEGLCDTFTLQLFPGPVNGKTHKKVRRNRPGILQGGYMRGVMILANWPRGMVVPGGKVASA